MLFIDYIVVMLVRLLQEAVSELGENCGGDNAFVGERIRLPLRIYFL